MSWFGLRRAQCWYRWQVLRSIWPLSTRRFLALAGAARSGEGFRDGASHGALGRRERISQGPRAAVRTGLARSPARLDRSRGRSQLALRSRTARGPVRLGPGDALVERQPAPRLRRLAALLRRDRAVHALGPLL